mgnify:CR=1 FL=1
MTDINKIIRVLDLSQSEAREGTLDGILKYILYSKTGKSIERKLIAKEIEKELTIVVHEQDINDSIVRLLDKDLIENEGEGKLKLSNEENLKIKQEGLKINENRKARFKLFKKHIEDIATENDYAIVEKEISDLWEIFRTFIYDCYLTHGKNAIDSLTIDENEYDESVKKLVNKYIKEAENKILGKILKKYIIIYPKIIDSNILEYLKGLANKTEAFYSLGLSQDEYEKLYDELKFDWIVFVDTNFIYSILDLHSNPEKESAKFLLELGTELGIKFKYTTKTFNELNNRKKDFDRNIVKDLVPSQISAMLKSERLDDFARTYYDKLLKDRENTAHPSETIMYSQNIMKEKKLTIYNSKFDALTKNVDYLLDQESAYNSYRELLDDVREKRGLMRKGPKESIQVEHDVFLREVILHLRKSDVTSISNAKYFGVTLDKVLIKFDLYQLKKKSVGMIIPSFFKPSILLKKLLRQAPLQTKENYLRAFISTISTPAIDENAYSSKVTIRSVKFFNSMGIDNEKLILNCLKDELFLKNFEKNESDTEKLVEFVESEINKQITLNTKKIEDLEKTIFDKDKRLDKVKEFNDLTKEENNILIKKADELKSNIDLYSKELRKLRKRISKPKLESQTIQLDIYDEKQNIELDNKLFEKDRKNEILEQRIIKSKLVARRNNGILLAIVSMFLIFSIVLIYLFKDKSWNFMSKLISVIAGMDEVRRNLTYIIAPILLGTIDFFVIKKTINLLFDKDAKTKYLNKLKEELTNQK